MFNRRSNVVISVALALLLIVITCSCAAEKDDKTDRLKGLDEKIDNKTEAYRTDITDSMSSLTSSRKIAKYLMNWADAKGIRAKDDDGIIVMNVDGSIEYKDAPQTVIVCPYDVTSLGSSINPLVMTMYALKNNEETGRLTALFVPDKGHDMSRYRSLKKKYFKKNENIICLNGDAHAVVSEQTGGASMYEFTRKLKNTTPKNLIAYRIQVSGIVSNQIDNKINMKINPIVEVNTLLANLKKSSIDYEIASINGGRIDQRYPGSCTLKITVDEDRQALFEKKINSRIESFNKRKQSEDPEAVYEYRKIRVPDKVISQEDSAKLVAFVYTLLEDEYYRDEESDNLIAVCDTSYIRSRKGRVTIGSTAYSTDETVLKEIDEATETLCGLSEFRFRKIGSIPAWQSKTENSLSERIRKAYSKYTGKDLIIQATVTPGSAGYVAELNDKCDIISMTISDSTMKDLTGTLMNYLIGLNEE